MAKPDNREDNPARIQNAIDNTMANLNEAEEYLDEHADEISAVDKESIESKNARRKESINGFIAEKKDESNAQE
ncbi:small acid-soluble spore protein Tlp [Paenibacillus sp. LjRoot56]|uniref:small acid-soluble spore protein Tlp n=1 Tax=Paenibacillus sp. LjRoot56 TaxID=3342333 RepID=UPI003ECC9EB2